VDVPDTLTLSNDEELLDRFRRGVTEAFGVLLRRYERELYGYLRRYLGDSTLAEDVFQNTFLQVYLKSGQFEDGRSVRPWLYAIATNQAIDALRRQARHQAVSLEQAREVTGEGDPGSLSQALVSDHAGPPELAADGETREQVRARVDRLPENLRHVLILAYYQGLKYREIAEIVGIPVGTVKSRLHAALAKLQEAWPAPVTSVRT
jgi:RNA polymerase sigma-70 factor (ECF subfamily)